LLHADRLLDSQAAGLGQGYAWSLKLCVAAIGSISSMLCGRKHRLGIHVLIAEQVVETERHAPDRTSAQAVHLPSISQIHVH